MTAVPVTRTWVAGEIVTAAYMNTTIRDVDNWLLAVAILEIRQTVSQNVVTGTSFVDITFDVEDVDSTGMHSIVSLTNRATAVYPGWYDTGGAACYAANATGQRAVRTSVNATGLNASESVFGAFASVNNSIPLRGKKAFLNAGDYLTVQTWQNSGGTLATAVATSAQSSMSLSWRSN